MTLLDHCILRSALIWGCFFTVTWFARVYSFKHISERSCFLLKGCAREGSESICAVYSPMQEAERWAWCSAEENHVSLTKTQALLSLSRSESIWLCLSPPSASSSFTLGFLKVTWARRGAPPECICCAATAPPSGPTQLLHRWAPSRRISFLGVYSPFLSLRCFLTGLIVILWFLCSFLYKSHIYFLHLLVNPFVEQAMNIRNYFFLLIFFCWQNMNISNSKPRNIYCKNHFLRLLKYILQ